MALSNEVKASIIIVAGQWANSFAKIRLQLNDKTPYRENLENEFKAHYNYLAYLLDGDSKDMLP